MEGTTDPSVLEHRLYYKIGSFVYDNAKVVLIATLLLGVGLAGLMTLEPVSYTHLTLPTTPYV